MAENVATLFTLGDHGANNTGHRVVIGLGAKSNEFPGVQFVHVLGELISQRRHAFADAHD
jgi:hypothetical protein